VRRVVMHCVLIALSCSVSFAQAPEPSGIWTGPVNSPVPATLAGGKVIDATALAKLLDVDKAIVIDVSNQPRRPEGMAPDAPWLPLPHEAIPGSVWIPDVGNGAIAAGVEAFFRTQLKALTDGDTERMLVFYCHERCWLSWNAARRAIDYGYRSVAWFPEGIEGWRAAGFPTQTVKARTPAPDNPPASRR
jgi:PQQ-dependent catabolism-associated CXXCW motif protein